jgi:hypothetical protein
VGDLNDRRPAFVELFEELHDFLALTRVKVARRLIRQDDFGARDDGARDGDELLLSAGQLVRIQVLLADDCELVEDVAHHAFPLRLLDVAVRERDVEVFVDREVIEQVVALKHEADVLLVQLGAILGRELVHRLVEKVVLPRPRAVVHADDVQQRRLSGARRPHDGDELPLLHIQVDPAQHVRAARAVRIRFLDISQADERVRCQGLG